MDDSKLLQDQPCRAPIKLWISFNQHHRLEKEGLVNFMEDTGHELGSPAVHPSVDIIHYSTAPRGVHGAEI